MKAFTTILFISLAGCIYPQTIGEFKLITYKQHLQVCPHHQRGFSGGEASSFTEWLFRFYKRNISSQDYYSCNFSLSCSAYALESVQKQGWITGLMNTFDRLSRCHGLNRKAYPVDHSTLLLIDPVYDAHYHPL